MPCYEFLNYKFSKKYIYLKILVSTAVISLFYSVFFYTIVLYTEYNYSSLLLGNIIGKQISFLFFSFVIYIYLLVKNRSHKKPTPKNMRDVFKIFSF
ncbi:MULTISPECIES: hypothetical protein [Flavobacterium]|uniref:Vitamin uptake-like sensor domain-containing protein n=1 Tax=Flavobacterium jumunjinense TaxID=998845 RepID=A0ABV5GQP7_9FLAO